MRVQSIKTISNNKNKSTSFKAAPNVLIKAAENAVYYKKTISYKEYSFIREIADNFYWLESQVEHFREKPQNELKIKLNKKNILPDDIKYISVGVTNRNSLISDKSWVTLCDMEEYLKKPFNNKMTIGEHAHKIIEKIGLDELDGTDTVDLFIKNR